MTSKKNVFLVGLEGKTYNIHIDEDGFEVSNLLLSYYEINIIT